MSPGVWQSGRSPSGLRSWRPSHSLKKLAHQEPLLSNPRSDIPLQWENDGSADWWTTRYLCSSLFIGKIEASAGACYSSVIDDSVHWKQSNTLKPHARAHKKTQRRENSALFPTWVSTVPITCAAKIHFGLKDGCLRWDFGSPWLKLGWRLMTQGFLQSEPCWKSTKQLIMLPPSCAFNIK